MAAGRLELLSAQSVIHLATSSAEARQGASFLSASSAPSQVRPFIIYMSLSFVMVLSAVASLAVATKKLSHPAAFNTGTMLSMPRP